MLSKSHTFEIQASTMKHTDHTLARSQQNLRKPNMGKGDKKLSQQYERSETTVHADKSYLL